MSEITLTQFRNFLHRDFSFPAPVIGITGSNGSGKTNLLDAVYYLCYTKSYFQSRELQNVSNGYAGFRLEGKWKAETAGAVPEETVCIWREGKKRVLHNNSEYEKITDHIGQFTAVMIAPDDIAIINGASERRRRFFDGLLAQSEPDYLQHLLHYQRVLQQRNAYLKCPGPVRSDLLEVYDEQLCRHGGGLIAGRQKIAIRFPEWVNDYYATLSGGKERTALEYRKSAAAEDLPALFARSRQRDIEYKRTLNGPHTDDWIFTLNGCPFKTHASQGQKKSFLIALKLSHIRWLQQMGKKPMLLLDDIFEKLDRHRLLQLFGLLQHFTLGQIFISHTEEKDLSDTLSPFYPALQIVSV